MNGNAQIWFTAFRRAFRGPAGKRVVLSGAWLASLFFVSACQGQTTLRSVSTSRAGVGYGVCVDAGHAYVTNNDGVIIFDVREPGDPREVGSIETGYTPDVVVEGGWAYVASERGLIVADVSSPASPRQVGVYAGEGAARRVRVEGSIAYVAGSSGLEIVDISDPSAPAGISHLSGGEAWGVDILEDIVYLAVPGSGLDVIDAGDPASPRKIGLVPGTENAWDVHVHQELAYVACHDGGITILNLAARRSPRTIGRHLDDDGGEALAVWGDGDHLYVADNFGIEVLDVRDPANPYEIGEYGRVNGAHDLDVDGAFVYVAEGRQGLVILEFTGE